MYELQLTADARADLQRLDATIRRLGHLPPFLFFMSVWLLLSGVCVRKSVIA